VIRTRTETDIQDDGDRQVLNDIAEYGWHVVKVLEEGDTPGWAFTIGLTKNYGHPEIVVFGLNGSVSHGLLNIAGEKVKNGESLASGSVVTGLLEGYECILREVKSRWYGPFLGTAIWYYLGCEFPALQCIWPDKSGKYPWHEEFRESWRWAQPLLYAEDPVEANAEALLETLE